MNTYSDQHNKDRVRKSLQLAMRAAEDLGRELDTLILATPTGPERNKVCDANIRLGELKANLKEFKAP